VLAPVAFIVANLLILWSGWTTDWKLGVAILIGYVILIANRLFKLNPTAPLLDFKAAQWLPVYLVGMGLIVWPQHVPADSCLLVPQTDGSRDDTKNPPLDDPGWAYAITDS